MASKTDEAAKDLYLDLMVEARVRAECIDVAIRTSNLPKPLTREFAYLQLRMICELIALACLVAHGDIAPSHVKRFGKAYAPGEILRNLEALHPDFYPVPVTLRPMEEVENGWQLLTPDIPTLTKSDLIKLYGKCGDILHKGNIRKLLKDKSNPVIGYQDVLEWRRKILNLLSRHLISRVGGRFHFLTEIQETGPERTVTVFIVEK